MENILKYYNFSSFFIDQSKYFNNPISYAVLNEQHFLIFENENEKYHLYVTKFSGEDKIGKEKPEIAELVFKNYDTSNPEHRVELRKYFGE